MKTEKQFFAILLLSISLCACAVAPNPVCEKLSRRDHEVLKKYYFEWISLKEIASGLAKSYGTTAKILHDTRKRLKKSVTEMLKD